MIHQCCHQEHQWCINSTSNIVNIDESLIIHQINVSSMFSMFSTLKSTMFRRASINYWSIKQRWITDEEIDKLTRSMTEFKALKVRIFQGSSFPIYLSKIPVEKLGLKGKREQINRWGPFEHTTWFFWKNAWHSPFIFTHFSKTLRKSTRFVLWLLYIFIV